MADIKTREHSCDIKVLDKSAVAGERMKNAFVRSKEQAKNWGNDNESSPSEYAENKVQYAVEGMVAEVEYEAKQQKPQKKQRKNLHKLQRKQQRLVHKQLEQWQKRQLQAPKQLPKRRLLL